MRFDPRRPQADEIALLRAREEVARLLAENARLASLGQHRATPANTPTVMPALAPGFGRVSAVRPAVTRTTRPATMTDQRRYLVLGASVVLAFLLGFAYANELSDGAALRAFKSGEGRFQSP